jgi:hypothetical protein
MRRRMSAEESIERRLQGLLRASLRRLGIRNGTAAIIFATGPEMNRLKAAFYKKKRKSGGLRRAFSIQKGGRSEPDVLSFDERRYFPHPEARGRFLGEIYLHKKLLAKPPRLKLLLIHGLLHLLGYSHTGKRDTLKMQTLEKRLMRHETRDKRPATKNSD